MQFDLEWLLLVPIIGQATESIAANAHVAATNAMAVASSVPAQANSRFVTLMRIRWISTFIYFVPSVIAKGLKMTIVTAKNLTLKVFGSGQ